MSYEEMKPFHEVVGLDALIGSKLQANEDFEPPYSGNGYMGRLEGDVLAWCKEPVREGDIARITQVMRHGNAVFIKLEVSLKCSGTQQMLDTAELALQNKAEIDVLREMLIELRHDVDRHEDAISW